MKLRPWYVVFAENPTCPLPASLIAAVRPPVSDLMADFGSSMPWFEGSFKFQQDSPSVSQVLFARTIDSNNERLTGLVKWLLDNSGLDTPSEQEKVIAHLRRTKQVISLTTLPLSRSARMARVCEQVCGHLCRTLNGVIQVHQEGFFSPEGESILPKNKVHRLKTA